MYKYLCELTLCFSNAFFLRSKSEYSTTNSRMLEETHPNLGLVFADKHKQSPVEVSNILKSSRPANASK